MSKSSKSDTVKTSSKVETADISLYKNCILVCDHIWVPEELAQNFYNNLHLGHRGVDIMMRLAMRTVFWINIKSDLTSFYNECGTCTQSMEKNKKQERIREEEVHYPFEKLTMDIAETNAK